MDALPILRKGAPRARVLILTMHADSLYLRQALKRGAAGYLLKKAADVELLSVIQAVMHSEVYVHQAMTRTLLEDALDAHLQARGEADWWYTF